MTDGLLYRSAELRADPKTGTVEGIAVPYDTPISVGGIREQFAPGSIDPDNARSAKLFWQHGDIIGKVIEAESRDDGLHVLAQISDTTQGRDARTLIKDGAVDSFSVGFVPIEDREEQDGTITRVKVDLREVSAVTWPAYADAKITGVRHEDSTENNTTNTNTEQEARNMGNQETEAQGLAEVRESIEDLSRRIDTIDDTRNEEPTVDNRTAGEVLKQIVRGDDATIDGVNAVLKREYSGGTSSDTVTKDGWVGDLTRIFDNSSGVLASVFSTGNLPNEGMNIEYGKLDSNSVEVKKQDAEGDDLNFGKVKLTTDTAPVHTYGGYTQLTRQEIERSSLPILNRSLEALAVAAGKRAKQVIRDAFDTVVGEQETATNVVDLGETLGDSGAADWVSVAVDAAGAFDDEGLPITALIVSKSVFKHLAGLNDGTRTLMAVANDGVNTIGSLNVPALNGNLAGIRVVLDTGQVGDSAVFANEAAIRSYQSPVVSLQDENIVNLSKDFSVYRYGAVAAEIPAGIVPVAFGD